MNFDSDKTCYVEGHQDLFKRIGYGSCHYNQELSVFRYKLSDRRPGPHAQTTVVSMWKAWILFLSHYDSFVHHISHNSECYLGKGYSVFTGKLTKVPRVVTLYIRETVQPMILSAWRVPYAARERSTQELQIPLEKTSSNGRTGLFK